MAQDGRWFYKTDVAEDEEMPRPIRLRSGRGEYVEH